MTKNPIRLLTIFHGICWFSGSSDSVKEALENLSGIFACNAYQKFAISKDNVISIESRRVLQAQKSQDGVLLAYHLTLLEDLIYVKNAAQPAQHKRREVYLRPMLVDSCRRLSSPETSSWESSKQQPKFACSSGA
jgi:hypothetical protein